MSVLLRNNVKFAGTGSTVMMFAHGFGCDQNMWRYLIPSFEKDYKIITFDYVGSGKSDRQSYNRERYVSLQGYALDILEICEELNLNNIIFVGHSVSSMIGMIAALQKPKLFKSLIMIGPSPCYINDGEYIGGFEKSDIDELLNTMDQNYIGWSHTMAPYIMANPDKPEFANELTDSFCSTDPVIARQFAEATFLSDNRKDLENLAVSTLLLQCSEDIIAPQEVGQFLAQHIPDSKLNIMQATGHCPHVSSPQETIILIKQYLATNH